jgi:hypothetical protein
MIKKIIKFLRQNWRKVAIALGILIVLVAVIAISNKNKGTSTEETVTTTTLSQTGPFFNHKNVLESDKEARYNIAASYPILAGIANTVAETKMNQIMVDYVNGEIKSFKNEVVVRNTDSNIPTELKSEIVITYRVEYLSDKLVSILFNSEAILAGDAHPNHKMKAINYSLGGNKEIVLADIFAEGSGYLTFISNNTIKYLKSLNISTDEMIQSGAKADVKNYSNFFITDQAIVFVFDRYSVAPYVAGEQNVYFTFEDVKNFLIQDGVLKSLLVNNII